jgi:hypothetical protein
MTQDLMEIEEPNKDLHAIPKGRRYALAFRNA